MYTIKRSRVLLIHTRFKRSFHFSNQNSSSHYDTLGIPRSSTTRQIKKRFFELSKKYHPDKTRTFQTEQKEEYNKKFQKIKEAYDTLSNTSLRTSYDNSLISSSSSSSSSTTERPSGQTHLRRRKVYNYGRPYTNPHMHNSSSTTSSTSSSTSDTTHDASGNNPLNPGHHRSGSNYDVPHFDFDKHFKQQQGYEQHRQQRVRERAEEFQSQHQQYEYYQNKRSKTLSLSAIGTLSAVAVAAFAYFH